MLIQFTVENHRSIKNSAVISFAASKDRTNLFNSDWCQCNDGTEINFNRDFCRKNAK